MEKFDYRFHFVSVNQVTNDTFLDIYKQDDIIFNAWDTVETACIGQ